jgi:hypothetical protein
MTALEKLLLSESIKLQVCSFHNMKEKLSKFYLWYAHGCADVQTEENQRGQLAVALRTVCNPQKVE